MSHGNGADQHIFTEPQLGKMRVVVSGEQWTQTEVIAGERIRTPKESHWRWLVSRQLDSSTVRTIQEIGQRRWGIENHAFNELTCGNRTALRNR